VELNLGGAMNEATGIFTAPRPGKYFFSASGIARHATPSSLMVVLIKNGVAMSKAYADESNTNYQYETFSLQSTLSLRAGDQMWLEIGSISPGASLHGDNFTHFTGFLIEEDISQSLAPFA
jgi:C1q-related factor